MAVMVPQLCPRLQRAASYLGRKALPVGSQYFFRCWIMVLHKELKMVIRGSKGSLAFSSSGGMGPTATIVYKHNIAILIAEKRS